MVLSKDFIPRVSSAECGMFLALFLAPPKASKGDINEGRTYFKATPSSCTPRTAAKLRQIMPLLDMAGMLQLPAVQADVRFFKSPTPVWGFGIQLGSGKFL